MLSVFVPSFFMEGVAKGLVRSAHGRGGLLRGRSFHLVHDLGPCAHHLAFERRTSCRGKESSKSRFDRFREGYAHLIERFMKRKKTWVVGYLVLTLGLAAFLLSHVGKEIFPIVNEGQFKVRLRAPTGSSLDFTEKMTLKVLDIVNQLVGKERSKARSRSWASNRRNTRSATSINGPPEPMKQYSKSRSRTMLTSASKN